MSAQDSAEKVAPDVCPTCHVIKPATCRNERGAKVWPAHWQRVTPSEAGPLSGLRDVAPEDEPDEWGLRR